MARRIKVRGVPKKTLTPDQVGYVFWAMAKRQVEEKRQREQKEREEQRARTAVSS